MSLPIERMEEFCTKYNLGDGALIELKQIVNDTIEHIGTYISNNKTILDKKNKCIGQSKTGNSCRFFAMPESQYCKAHQPKADEIPTDGYLTPPQKITSGLKVPGAPIKLNKTQCYAVVKGRECKQNGKYLPDGAMNKYCHRHKDNWKLFEGSNEETNSTGASAASAAEVAEVSVLDLSSLSIDDTIEDSESPRALDDLVPNGLSETQNIERRANGMTVSEYIEADAMYTEVSQKMKKILDPEAFNEWEKKFELRAFDNQRFN